MRYFLSISASALIILIFIIKGLFFSYPLSQEQNPIIIEKGSSITKIAEKLHKNKATCNFYFTLMGAALFKIAGKKLKSGEYQFQKNQNTIDVLMQIANGSVVKHFLTIPEGLTVSEIIEKIEKIEILKGEIKNLPEEGSLLPQTYDYYYADSRQSIIDRMKSEMDKLKYKYLGQENSDWKEILTIASIVEKETSIPTERAVVASVYLNRLEIGMPLQADPTVIYAVTNGKTSFARSISKTDLKIDSKYNTYINKNLPPTPIACPGEESIKAVINPADTNFLYFVANGKGGHEFSSNLKQHNLNVKNWKNFKNRGKF